MDVAERRARLVVRHHLRGDAASVAAAARAVVALHATDPATVYLAALARRATATLADVATGLYDQRALVRMMAMRRTLFVVPAEEVPTLHHAAAIDVAAVMRRRLVKELTAAPTDPPITEDVSAWLAETEERVVAALARLGTASGARLAREEPRLRTAVLPRTAKAYDVRRAVTSPLLVLLGAEGRIVRDRPLGGWTSRQHTWVPAAAYWPDGLPTVEEPRARLVAAYLRRFGPASEADVAWWTGWPLGTTRTTLAALEVEDTGHGLVLRDDTAPAAPPDATAALLPALDPTPMGWKERSWFLPADPQPLYDRFGNIGPTVWWGGEVVGGWAVRSDGSVAVRLLADRGQDAVTAVEEARLRLEERLGGDTVVPSFPTPLEKTLRTGG